MHELAIAQGVLDIVLDRAGDQRVELVKLQVGVLQRIAPESLRFCFDLVAQDTPAAAARLELDEVAIRVRCDACGFDSTAEIVQCPRCGKFDVQLLAGDGIEVAAVRTG